MIEWILRQLERQPSTLFYEKELREKSDSEFLELKVRKLLICVQPDSVCETYGYGRQRPMLAINLDGHYYAIDDDDSELLVLIELTSLNTDSVWRYLRKRWLKRMPSPVPRKSYIEGCTMRVNV